MKILMYTLAVLAVLAAVSCIIFAYLACWTSGALYDHVSASMFVSGILSSLLWLAAAFLTDFVDEADSA